MGRTRWHVAFFAGVLALSMLAATQSASAHVFYGNRSETLVKQLDGRRRLLMNLGETLRLTVANAPGADCKATIAAVGVPPQLTVTGRDPDGQGKTRVFTINANSTGTGSFDITVDGVSPCNEHSHNFIDVVVLPSETSINKNFLAASKSEGRLLGTHLQSEYGMLRMATSDILHDFSTGTTGPGPTALALGDRWCDAWTNGYLHARDVCRNLTNYGTGLLSSGGWPECIAPRPLGDGSRGPLDSLRWDAGLRLDSYRNKLDKQIQFDASAFSKTALKYDLNYSFNYDLREFPPIQVSGPSISLKALDPPAPLYIGYATGVSYAEPETSGSCVGFGGICDPSRGNLDLRLWDGGGLVGTRTITPEPNGEWKLMYDGLKPGKYFRTELSYSLGGGGYDSTYVYTPGLRHTY